jgi:hypothetical protein
MLILKARPRREAPTQDAFTLVFQKLKVAEKSWAAKMN